MQVETRATAPRHASCVDGSREDSVRRPFRVRSVAVTDASPFPPPPSLPTVPGRYQIIVCLHLSLELMIRPPFHRTVMRRILRSAAQTPYTRCLSLGELLRPLSTPTHSLWSRTNETAKFPREERFHPRDLSTGREKRNRSTERCDRSLLVRIIPFA